MFNYEKYIEDLANSKKMLKTSHTHSIELDRLFNARKQALKNHNYQEAREISHLGTKMASQMEYRNDIRPYLRTLHWISFSNEMKDNAFGCSICRRPKDLLNAKGLRLEVHHHHYNSLFQEKTDDVAVLCEICHNKIEKVFELSFCRREIKQWEFGIHPLQKNNATKKSGKLFNIND